MSDIARKTMQDALTMAENNLQFYERRVVEAQAVLDLHLRRADESRARVTNLRQALEELL